MAHALLARPGLLAYGLLAVSALFTVPGRGWWAAITFSLVCIGLGRSLLESRVGQTLGLSGTFGSLFAGLVGWWLIVVVTVILSSLGALSAWSAGATGLAAAGVALHLWWRHPAVANKFAPSRTQLALAFLAVAVLAPYLIRSLLPDSDWDAALYHLPMARHFVTDGLWTAELRPDALYRPGVVQSCYAFFFALELDSALIPLNTLAVAATALVCYRVGVTFWDRRVGGFGSLVFLSSCIVLEYGVDVRVEPFLILFFIAAVAAGMLWLRERSLGSAVMCALCAGLLAGTKYNGLVFAGVVLGPAAVALWVVRGSTARQRLAASVLAGLVFLVPSSVFYVRNQVLFGNAMHPFRTSTKATNQWAERLLGKDLSLLPKGMRPPKEAIERLNLRQAGSGRGTPEAHSKYLALFNAIRNPMAHSTKPFHSVSPWILLFLLIPAFARDRWSLGLFGFGLGSYFLTVAAMASGGDFPVRYLVPLVPVLSIGTGICLSRAHRRAMVIALAVGVALPLFYGSFRQYHFLSYLRPDKFLSGTENELEFLARVGFNGPIINPDGTIRFANTGMPSLALWLELQIQAGAIDPQDRIFMIAEGKTSRIPLDCLPSNSNTGRRFLNRLQQADWDYAKLRDKLWDDGFRFLLVNKGWMHWSNENSNVNTEALVVALYNIGNFIEQFCDMNRIVKFDGGLTFLVPLEPK